MSSNLPTWAYQLGYSLKGDMGTYGTLYLDRKGYLVREFGPGKSPSIFEIGDIISELESEEVRWSSKIAYQRI